jgi:ABC-type spermidine/putrescine transport system, permease component II
VIPLVVLGLSLFLLFHVLGVQLSILTIAVGHVVIVIPYTILVLLPRLEQIDRGLGRGGVRPREPARSQRSAG